MVRATFGGRRLCHVCARLARTWSIGRGTVSCRGFRRLCRRPSSCSRNGQGARAQLAGVRLGHSAGGVIGTLYALDYGAEVAGFICEDFAFELPAPDVALAILKGLSHVAPHAHVLTLNNADFTRDSTVLSTMNADPLIAKESQPLATVAALVRADERLRRSFALVTCPVLIIHGAEDKAAKPAGSERFFKEAGSIDKSLKVYEGRLHDPLNDLGREDVLADIIAWIGARLTSQEQGAKA